MYKLYKICKIKLKIKIYYFIIVKILFFKIKGEGFENVLKNIEY